MGGTSSEVSPADEGEATPEIGRRDKEREYAAKRARNLHATAEPDRLRHPIPGTSSLCEASFSIERSSFASRKSADPIILTRRPRVLALKALDLRKGLTRVGKVADGRHHVLARQVALNKAVTSPALHMTRRHAGERQPYERRGVPASGSPTKGAACRRAAGLRNTSACRQAAALQKARKRGEAAARPPHRLLTSDL